MSKRRRITLVRTLNGRITLLFLVMVALVSGLLAYNWLVLVQPRLKAEAQSTVVTLAEAQAHCLSLALSPEGGALRQSDVIKVLDDTLLWTDPHTSRPLISGVSLELDHGALPLAAGSLHLDKPAEACPACLVAKVPLRVWETRELLGNATFRVNSEHFQRVQRDVLNDFLLICFWAFALIIFFCCLIVLLLKQLNVVFVVDEGARGGERPGRAPAGGPDSGEPARFAGEFKGMGQTVKEREREREWERELLDSQKRVRDLFARVEHALFRMDCKFKIVECNAPFELLCEQSTDFFACIAGGKREMLRARAGEGDLLGLEVEIAGRDGKKHVISLSIYPERDRHGVIRWFDGYFVDITERKKMEATLRQARKFESLGLLAGGIAHDFNNILTSVIGYSELSLLRASTDEQLRKNIENVRDAGNRAAALTRHLLAFSRRRARDVRVLSLNALVDKMIKMLGRLIGEHIEIKVLCHHGGPDNVKADPGQIEQLIMNLAVNAKEAMPDGGKLIIETGTLEVDRQKSSEYRGLSPGRYVVLSVSDTGGRMAAEAPEKIFASFFNAKENKTDIGPGLPLVYEIVAQLRGHIFCSEGCRGATFKIFFPAAPEESDDEVTAVLVGGRRALETLLVVEDDASVRALVRDTLQAHGYRVLEAADGLAALELLGGMRERVDLLCTDVIMPKMNGKELAEKVEELRPGIKVLFMSGYTDEVVDHQGILKAGGHVIHKPLVPGVLSRKVRRVLDGE